MILFTILIFFGLSIYLFNAVKAISMSNLNEDQFKNSNEIFLEKNNKQLLGINDSQKKFLYKKERSNEVLNFFNNNNESSGVSQNFYKNNNPNQYIIYAPIKGKKIFTRIKYDSISSFVKKGKTRTATKYNNKENKKIKNIKTKNKNFNRLVDSDNEISKLSQFDNNELEYLSKSKGVIPIPNRPKFIEYEKLFLTNETVDSTKRVTLKKKKLFDYFDEISTTTMKLPTKVVSKITQLSIFNEKKKLIKSGKKILTADEALSNCCIKKRISHDCQQLCSFKEISDKTLVQAVLTNKCPNGELKEVFECANNGDDHTQCCYNQNVHLINNGQCMAFCSKTSTQITDILQYFICLQVFEKIKSCYIINFNIINSRTLEKSNFNSYRLL
uniref:DB domain-containing protein n=1 Tax=Strongyloides stercoralis TaxID=6248 RepID=A0A913I161_STRER